MMKARFFWLMIILVVPLFVQGVFDHPLWINDEGHVAEIGREMYLSGDVVVPRLNGEPFVEKPPLYFMIMGVCYRFFGITPGAARLPSAIFGFLTVLVTFAIASAYGNRRQGLIAGFILASCSMMFRFSHWCVVDSGVCFFATLGYYTFLRAYKSESAKLWWYIAFYVSCALAFMTKGLIGPIFLSVAVIALLLWERDLYEIRRMGLWVGIPVFLIIVAPWCFLLWDVGGTDLFKEFWIGNNIGRFANSVSTLHSEHVRGFFYYYYDFPGNFLPWTPIFFPALVWALKRACAQQEPSRTLYRFLVAGFIVNVFIASFSSTKRGVYILPLYPLVALFVGGWLDDLLNGRQPFKWERVFLWIQATVICVFPLILLGMQMYFKTMNITVLAVLWLAFLALGIFAITAFRKGNIAHVFRNLAIQTVLTYSVIVCLVFPVISPFKHHTAFFESISGLALRKDVVAIYGKMHESNLGQACISFGRTIPVISDPQQAVRLFESQGRRVFLITEGKYTKEVEPLMNDGVRIICEQQPVHPLSSPKDYQLTCFASEIIADHGADYRK